MYVKKCSQHKFGGKNEVKTANKITMQVKFKNILHIETKNQ